MEGTRITVWVLFIASCIASGLFLTSIPGLLGDEASEGENVYELLNRDGITIIGERSYIGPAIDYIRVPFVAAFGYTVLAIRLPMLFFSLGVFWLAHIVLRNQFKNAAAIYGVTFVMFSPIYLMYQRLGWAITLFPFFLFLTLYLAQSTYRYKWVWAGLAAGLGLANHILFFPVLVGILMGSVVLVIWNVISTYRNISALLIEYIRPTITALSLAVIGFVAGFGMQFAVLQLHTDDQGDPEATTQQFSERTREFLEAAPLYISGSAYAAQYTAKEFSGRSIVGITYSLLGLVVCAVILNWKNKYIWAHGIGFIAHTIAMLYMIDRFNLRYFTVFALGTWMLAGIGLGSIVRRIKGSYTFAPGIAVIFLLAVVLLVFLPFRETGGSIGEFSLGNRTNDAAAFVAIDPLIECLRGEGPIYSENVHIWNRLQYASHQHSDLEVVSEKDKGLGKILVNYSDNNRANLSHICPNLVNFNLTFRD